jgi:dUTP pyrophosphatase
VLPPLTAHGRQLAKERRMPDDPATLEVAIHRVDPTLPLPSYATAGAVGFDLLCRVETTIAPGAIALLPSNVIVRTPPGYMLLVVPRSSTPRRLGLVTPHGVGIIDQDYCGPDDEILIQVQNIRAEPVTIPRGERLSQGIFVRIAVARWHEVERPQGPSRGGFGSS